MNRGGVSKSQFIKISPKKKNRNRAMENIFCQNSIIELNRYCKECSQIIYKESRIKFVDICDLLIEGKICLCNIDHFDL